MHDPLEGVTPLGTITTGVARSRVPSAFEPVLGAAVAAIVEAHGGTVLYVYGSVATGMARLGTSDVDLLTIGMRPALAGAIGRALSRNFPDVCRGVELAAAQLDDFSGEDDCAYGARVFLRHYCVHLAGEDQYAELPDFAADVRAARGFNGDIAGHARGWRTEFDDGCDPETLGRRVARKTLLAVSGLVSVHDSTWMTDRDRAATRWAEVQPALAAELDMLRAWSEGSSTAELATLGAALDGVVPQVIDSFSASIGLWGSRA